MPRILHSHTSGSVPVVFDGHFAFVADILAAKGLRGDFDGAFDFVADMDTVPALSGIFEGTFEFVAPLSPETELLADFQANFDFVATLKAKQPPDYRLSVTLTILPSAASANHNIRKWLPRLLVNGVEVEIISWSVPSGGESVGEKLQVVLQKWTDKTKFTNSSVISFGIGKKIAGVWDETTFKTLVPSATFQVSSHSVNGEPQNAGDRVSISMVGNLINQLNTYPLTPVVVFDGSRSPQRPEYYQPLYDQTGYAYVTELVNVPSLSLQRLLGEILVGRCGFDEIETNLTDFPILDAFFPLGSRLFDGLKQFLGIFNPLIYRDDTKIGILDSTLLQPAGFPDHETIEVENVRSLNIEDDRSNRKVNAFRIRYIHNIEDFDTITTRTDDPVTEPEGENTVVIVKKWRDYYKASQPFVAVHSELAKEQRTTTDQFGNVVQISTEDFTYTAANQPESRTQTIEGFYPDLTHFTDALTEPPYLFGITAVETEMYGTASYPVDQLAGQDQQTYIRSRDAIRQGKILVDTEALHLGKPFRQEYVPGIRSGNIKPGMTFDYGTIKSHTETAEPIAGSGGECKITTVTTDYLPKMPVPFVTFSQTRQGSISAKSFTSSERVLILRAIGDSSPIQSIQDIHFGELSIDDAINLAQRQLNAGLQSPKGLSCDFIGYDDTLRPGAVRKFQTRDDADGAVYLGIFMIVAVTTSGDAGGTFMNLSCREVKS